MIPRGMPIGRDDKDVRDGAVTNANLDGGNRRKLLLLLLLFGATSE